MSSLPGDLLPALEELLFPIMQARGQRDGAGAGRQIAPLLGPQRFLPSCVIQGMISTAGQDIFEEVGVGRGTPLSINLP